jgi:hypothetical protein
MTRPAIKRDDDDEPNSGSVGIMRAIDDMPPEFRALETFWLMKRVLASPV